MNCRYVSADVCTVVTLCTVVLLYRCSPFRTTCVSDIVFVSAKIETKLSLSKVPSKNRDVYETARKRLAEPCVPQVCGVMDN